MHDTTINLVVSIKFKTEALPNRYHSSHMPKTAYSGTDLMLSVWDEKAGMQKLFFKPGRPNMDRESSNNSGGQADRETVRPAAAKTLVRTG